MRSVLFLLLLLPAAAFCQSRFDEKIRKEAAALKCPPPEEARPVTVNAMLVTDNDSLAVVVKTAILPGWHIYAFVPDNQPYIQLDPILEAPASLRKAGAWIKSEPMPSMTDPGVLIYEDQALFVQKFARTDKAGGKIKAGLYFQCCDIKQCLPPDETTVQLTF
ncbi:protein-disulfide reductase DsbD domain-containing protein [Chitinophaga sp.]|uniref:protein-disulfide reductase DsbD domain-containing protein n=1 Tax=Chitinophaga sp. TaxID=1869181 RepID=UPI00262E94B6|nr:protein-disulfide reductase DsbD domain-containing protein [uncultured Chitinophaga sp.]